MPDMTPITKALEGLKDNVQAAKGAVSRFGKLIDAADYVPEWKLAFPEFTDPGNNLCGIETAYGTKEQIVSSKAVLIGTAEDVANRNHVGYNTTYHQGYFIDDFQHETYLCNVYRWENDVTCPECGADSADYYAKEPDGKGGEYDAYACNYCDYKYSAGEEFPVTLYFAMTESDESDCTWLDPEAYETDLAAALASDHMTEKLAETERNYQFVWSRAGKCSQDLHEANDIRRKALGYLRQARQHKAELMGIHKGRVSLFAMRWIYPAAWRTIETMESEAQRLWDMSECARESVFAEIREHKPTCSIQFEGANWYEAWKAGELTNWQAEQASYVDAWADGWPR